MRNEVFVNGADGPETSPQLLGAVTLGATGSSGKLIKASVHDRPSGRFPGRICADEVLERRTLWRENTLW